MRVDWTGRHVIVTGGSEGIGAAVAAAFARRGARVSIIARREEPLRATAERIGAEWCRADVTDRAGLATAIKELETRHGPCAVLACCAGLTLPGRFLDIDDDEFGTQIEANYLGSVYAVRCVLAGMVERGSGHILLLSSTSAFLGIVGYSSYGPTKASVRQLGLCLRYEAEPAGVTVSVLYPADTDTPGLARENLRKPAETKAITGSITPMPADKVADAAVRGLERGRHHIALDPLTSFFMRWANLPEDLSRPFFRRSIARAKRASQQRN
ncbi:SDR family NAD(P)-dependent oxidoreductase [Nocardia transvalensis]|uniref:SDR family NAD(P)-dependent oxidoreductase n=1 Tax=Nocardia transvalensis TaxID=37333 RepID=UPI00189389EE|nr:SDR family NAD(P)-dependent oxidoreductase [Nocardia transvalensis]MBF6329480.1 SDR family NAD(P)-dependent oxidoreductase [Nocardia transvalensis]